MERIIINNIFGNNSDVEINQDFRREMQNNPHLCDQKYFSWNCCFSKNTEITVKENNTYLKKRFLK